MSSNDKDILGRTVYDRVTNFRGVASSIIHYLSGCVQVGVHPPVKPDGSKTDGQFFDIQQLVVDYNVPRILLDNAASPGFGPKPGEREHP